MSMSNVKRKELDTGSVAMGKVAMVGDKDREINQVHAEVVGVTGRAPRTTSWTT